MAFLNHIGRFGLPVWIGTMSETRSFQTITHNAGSFGQSDVAPYEGVLKRRMLAFAIDYILIAIIVAVLGVLIGILGVLTFGLAWLLYAVLVPFVAIPYFAFSVGGPSQATPGMKAMGLKMFKDDGGQIDWLIATVHVVLFWVFNTVLTPLVLLLALFTHRKRTLHDILLSTNVQRIG
jgi:uncharacterized RDD family membrane protein YckC